jgi:ADP-ribose pyrophosphatase YjhB (NUDIX family)
MEVGFHTFPNGKQYAYAVKNGKRVFLRNALFLRNAAHPRTIAIVRTWGARSDRGAWEPPKGQVEWSEFSAAGIRPGARISTKQLYTVLRSGALREMREEAKLLSSDIRGLTALPTVYHQPHTDLAGAHIMYVFWSATLPAAGMAAARKRMAVFTKHPDIAAVLPHDVCEKDAIDWWSPEEGWSRIRGDMSEKMTRLFYSSM